MQQNVETAGVDTSQFAKKGNLASHKSKVDKLVEDKLENVPAGLRKLSDVVDNGVDKKTVYDKLVKKVNTIDNIDTRKLVKKTYYNSKIEEIEEKRYLTMSNVLLLLN